MEEDNEHEDVTPTARFRIARYYKIKLKPHFDRLFGAGDVEVSDPIRVQRLYLEYLILFLHITSMIISIINFAVTPLLHVRYFIGTKNCKTVGEIELSCMKQQANFSWNLYHHARASQQLSKLMEMAYIRFQDDRILNATVSRLHPITAAWKSCQSVWPFDLSSTIGPLILDVVRRIRRSQTHLNDAAPMFSCVLFLVATVFIRITEVYFFFYILDSTTNLFKVVNGLIEVESAFRQIEIPMLFCMAPPRSYFTVTIMGLLIPILNITFALDYMDPV